MKKILIIVALLASVICYGQDELQNKPKPDTLSLNANVRRAGVKFSGGKYYTEIYEVLTDTLVHRFGLEFRLADSSFVRKVPMSGINRKLYDQMQADTEYVLRNQERMRKETIEYINRYRTSPEVWLHFKMLEVLDK